MSRVYACLALTIALNVINVHLSYAQLFLTFSSFCPHDSLEVFFILVDKDGVALSGAEALVVLERSDVLARLRAYGYQATGYAAVVPPTEESPVKSGNHPVTCMSKIFFLENKHSVPVSKSCDRITEYGI